MKTLLALLFLTSIAHAEPFDAFVGHYVVTAAPVIQTLRAPTCNKYDFAQLQALDVIADRTGFRQTHSLRLQVPNGYSLVRVVPWYKDPSELDPSLGQFGQSEGDALKAVTLTGMFGFDKNETLELKLERTSAGVQLSVSNELKSKAGVILNGCYYSVALVKSVP